jgi:spore germination protein KB
MVKEGRFGVQEAVSLMVITISIKAYFTSPSSLAQILGTSSWLMTLISAATALVGFSFLYLLLKRFPGKDLIAIFDLAFGRFFGFAVSIIFFIFLAAEISILIREFAEVLKVYSLPETPSGFIILTLLAITTAACFAGLEGIARSARILAYYILLGFLLVIILSSIHFDYHFMFPIFGNGLQKTVTYGLARSSFYGEAILLGVIATSLQGVAHMKKAGFISIIFSGILVSITLAAGIMEFNYSSAQEITSQMYELSRSIHIADFLQRLDPLFLFTWCIGTMVSASFIQFCTLSIYCKAFRMQDMRPLIIPMSIVIFTGCMIPRDLSSIVEYVQITRQYGWIIYFGLPLLTLIISVVRKKKGVPQSA